MTAPNIFEDFNLLATREGCVKLCCIALQEHELAEAGRKNGHLQDGVRQSTLVSLLQDCLDAASQYGYPLPPELAKAHRVLHAVPLHWRRARPLKFWQARRLKLVHPELSIRQLARAVDVPPANIQRWQKSEDWTTGCIS
jgi:hypothetical protein